MPYTAANATVNNSALLLLLCANKRDDSCESNHVKSTNDAYEDTWKCGELKALFFPIRRRIKKKRKKKA